MTSSERRHNSRAALPGDNESIVALPPEYFISHRDRAAVLILRFVRHHETP